MQKQEAQQAAQAAAEATAEQLEAESLAAAAAAAAHAAPGAAHTALLEGGMSVAVVGSALVAVLEHVVSLRNLLKLGLGGFVARVFVWVIFDSLFAVSLF